MRTTQIVLVLTILWCVTTTMITFAAVVVPDSTLWPLACFMLVGSAIGSYVSHMSIHDHQWLPRQWHYFNHPTYQRPASILKNDLRRIIVQGNNTEIQKIYHEIFSACDKEFTEDTFITIAAYMTEHLTRTLIEEAMKRGVYTGEACDRIEALMVHQIAESSGEVQLHLIERDSIARKRLRKDLSDLGYS